LSPVNGFSTPQLGFITIAVTVQVNGDVYGFGMQDSLRCIALLQTLWVRRYAFVSNAVAGLIESYYPFSPMVDIADCALIRCALYLGSG